MSVNRLLGLRCKGSDFLRDEQIFVLKKGAYPFGMGSVSLRIRANGHTG